MIDVGELENIVECTEGKFETSMVISIVVVGHNRCYQVRPSKRKIPESLGQEDIVVCLTRLARLVVAVK